jgi:parallel beta-helix repeat protein
MKKIVTILLFVICIYLLLLIAPISSLDKNMGGNYNNPSQHAFINEYFGTISSSANLNRGFPLMPIRENNPKNIKKEKLGKLLYFDPLLSGDNNISCAHCHHPDLGFTDNRALSMGHGGSGIGQNRTGGVVLRRSSPTIWNSGYNHKQYWDGRADDLEHQAGFPIQDKQEMAQDKDELIKELQNIPEYVQLFNEAFGSNDITKSVTFENVTFAIAAFERTITANNTRFDQYSRGNHLALSKPERRGLNLFRSLKTRCFECHNFPTFNNPDFKAIGVPNIENNEPDLGRAEIVGKGYENAFKVPTLRNIALTAPYMHNGMFNTLDEVLDFYAGGGGRSHGFKGSQLDDKIRKFDLSHEERKDLVAFMHALTDESNKPTIPKSVPSSLPVVPSLDNQSLEMDGKQIKYIEPKKNKVERIGKKLIIYSGQSIQDGIEIAEDGDTVFVKSGEYFETLMIDKSNITIIGDTKNGDLPVLNGKNILPDAGVGTGSNIEINGFIIKDYTANGLMLNRSRNVAFRNVHCKNTGLYGLYPVECVEVLVEDCSVTGISDAGIYIGQSKDIVVRNNVTYGNVTGIEIENSVNALVENNEVYDNAGGILVFLLPNNPSKVSLNCRIVNNYIYKNNHVNFGEPGSIVSNVPQGTGLMIMAGDSVEVTGNRFHDNQSFGASVIGLDLFFGNDFVYDVDPIPDACWLHDNEYRNNGYNPAKIVKESGLDGADLLWDVTGYNNNWDEQNVTSIPPTLPNKDWSWLARKTNYRVWRLLFNIVG